MVVRETVPDRMLDEASEIEVIDLPPDERLYACRKARFMFLSKPRAIQKFFRKGNLTALRELSMRRAAERVDVRCLPICAPRRFPARGRRVSACWCASAQARWRRS